MRRLKTVRRPPIYPKTPGHLPCSSLTHPLPLSSRRPSVSFGGFGLKLNPGILEHFQRYQIEYHFGRGFAEGGNHWNIDWYYGDAVYAPLYWGYGRPGEYADRREMRKHYDEEVMHSMPDTVLVLIKATPEAIRQRMSEGKSPFPDRHAATMFKADDTEFVLDRFQEEFENSLIAHRFSIDTTDATPEESLKEFIEKVGPHLTAEDRERMKD